MIKILVKAAILVCIILSIYFIVNPSACSNLMSGRVVNSMEQVPTFVPTDDSHSELLTPAGDQSTFSPEDIKTQPTLPAQSQSAQPVSPEQPPVAVVTDTRSTVENPSAPAAADTTQAGQTFSQEDIDYAIASRYVELENEYIAKKKDTKNASKEISYIVMDDFELTPAEWEAFLQRATANNLFEKVRQQQAAK